jgi:hypothetical protein
VGLEPDIFTFETAFYLCIVTATTVGYGDIGVPDRWQPKLYASVHILFSVSSLAALLNTGQMLYSERKLQLRKADLLERRLDLNLIQSLDKDNNGLDKLEFVVGMLTKLEIVQWDDVEPFLAKFDELDKDRSGRLDKRDLMRMVEDERRRKAAFEQKRGGAATASAPAPSAAFENGCTQPLPLHSAVADDCDTVEGFASTPTGGEGKSRMPPSAGDLEGGFKGEARAEEGESPVAPAPNHRQPQGGVQAGQSVRWRLKTQQNRFGGLPFHLFAGTNKSFRRRRPTHLMKQKKRVAPKQ